MRDSKVKGGFILFTKICKHLNSSGYNNSDRYLTVKCDTLMDMVSHMKEGVGLVHQMPFVCDRPGFAAILEKVKRASTQDSLFGPF